MKKQKKSWHTCVNKEIYGGPISGTHYVDFFIALMMVQKLITKLFN
jgi:hypothetical protein